MMDFDFPTLVLLAIHVTCLIATGAMLLALVIMTPNQISPVIQFVLYAPPIAGIGMGLHLGLLWLFCRCLKQD